MEQINTLQYTQRREYFSKKTTKKNPNDRKKLTFINLKNTLTYMPFLNFYRNQHVVVIRGRKVDMLKLEHPFFTNYAANSQAFARKNDFEQY